jgi:hypothetical protein
MKLLRIACFVAVSLAILRNASGQGFVNLNFEQTVIVSSSPSGYGFNSGTANVTGWTEYNGWSDSNYSGGMSIIYNNQPLDSPGVSLVGTNYSSPAIQGKYSILLFGGDTYNTPTNGASIGQTGQIPLTAESLTYWGLSYNNLQITFDGQALSFNAISSNANYTVYGADISAYAGQTGELLFTAPFIEIGGPSYGGGVIDNIQFSPSPIPEPSELSLFGICLLFLCWRMKRPAAGLCTSQTFRVVGTPRCGVPVRQDGTNVVKAPFFRSPDAALGDGDSAGRAVPTLIVCERHNPKI